MNDIAKGFFCSLGKRTDHLKLNKIRRLAKVRYYCLTSSLKKLGMSENEIKVVEKAYE